MFCWAKCQFTQLSDTHTDLWWVCAKWWCEVGGEFALDLCKKLSSFLCLVDRQLMCGVVYEMIKENILQKIGMGKNLTAMMLDLEISIRKTIP